MRRLPWSTLALIALLVVVQAQLWLGSTGKPYTIALQLQLDRQLAANAAARLRNGQLEAEVRDLREGLEMVEERARWELGMVKPDEVLVQVTPARR
ncbi:MAG TPA: septum formation initiator family protein [Burkholderiaceae bacterium]|nr:septum formation initiator family protein [Burkholderiaceae bacterium]